MQIDFIQLLFYSMSAVALFGAAMVVFTRNPVRAVLSLVLTFTAVAGSWMLLQSEFLALTLILVYVGAVMVLFLFVVMMLKLTALTEEKPPIKGVASSIARSGGFTILAIILIAQIIWLFNKDAILNAMNMLPIMPLDYSNTKALGMSLFSEYVYPFEIAGVILTVAIIAAIGLATPGPRQRRVQDIASQIATKKSDRLSVLKNVSPDSGLTEEKQ